MKKLAFILTILLCLSMPVFASGELLVDDADILTDTQEQKLQQQLQQLTEEYGMDVVIVTVNGTGDKSQRDFADDYYDYNGYAADGVLLLLDMDNRELWISGTGEGEYIFSDDVIYSIGEEMAPYLAEDDFVGAFDVYIESCDYYMDNTMNVLIVLAVCLVIGLICALIVTGIFRGQLKSVRRKNQARDYVVPGSLVITQSRELFLYSNLRRVRRQQNSSGSHRSSSGRSHSGGGRSF